MKRPLGVLLIGSFYILGAVTLLVTVIFYDEDANYIGITERFGLSIIPEKLIRILVAIISLGMAYGYIRLKKWGYWLMITYSIYFGIESSLLVASQPKQPFIGNLIFSLIALVYTIYIRRYFYRMKYIRAT